MRRCRRANGRPGGVGLTLTYGFHPSPFGTAIVIAATAASPACLADPGGEQASLADMQRRWPRPPISRTTPARLALAQRNLRHQIVVRGSAACAVVLIAPIFEVGYGRR